MLLIPRNVPLKFDSPIFTIVFWHAVIATRTAVPEAAVDEDGELFADEAYVRAAGDGFVVESIAF